MAFCISVCDHEWGTHEQIAGRRDASGQFLSRSTAKYLLQLAEAFGDIIISLLPTTHCDQSFEAALQSIPKKAMMIILKHFKKTAGVFDHHQTGVNVV